MKWKTKAKQWSNVAHVLNSNRPRPPAGRAAAPQLFWISLCWFFRSILLVSCAIFGLDSKLFQIEISCFAFSKLFLPFFVGVFRLLSSCFAVFRLFVRFFRLRSRVFAVSELFYRFSQGFSDGGVVFCIFQTVSMVFRLSFFYESPKKEV